MATLLAIPHFTKDTVGHLFVFDKEVSQIITGDIVCHVY